MPPIITNVDQKLLRSTKFPLEFNEKVDTTKINVAVIKNWAAGEVSKLLGFEDDVVIGLLFDLLEGEKNPDIKSLQLQLAGFLGDDAGKFCKTLWNLCLSAQKSETGVPQQLLEAKKAELMQERQQQEQAAEQARRRREELEARDREVGEMRYRDRRDRDDRRIGRGGRDRDFDRRPPPRRGFSPSPPPRRPRPDYDYGRRPPPRGVDTYIPSGPNRPKREHSPRPSYDRRRSRSVSRSPPPPRHFDDRDRIKRSRRDSPPRRRYSPSPKRSRRKSFNSDSRSPPPVRHRRRGDDSVSRSPPRRSYGGRDVDRKARRRSPSSSPERLSRRADRRKEHAQRLSRSRSPSTTRDTIQSRKRSRSPQPLSTRRRRSPTSRSTSPAGRSKKGPLPEEKSAIKASKKHNGGDPQVSDENLQLAAVRGPTRSGDVRLSTKISASELREKLLKEKLVNAFQKKRAAN